MPGVPISTALTVYIWHNFPCFTRSTSKSKKTMAKDTFAVPARFPGIHFAAAQGFHPQFQDLNPV